jgi:hypothetical protein
MGVLDRLFGREGPERDRPAPAEERRREDERAIARYRYLLQTAPPEAIEQAHAEAFAQLTPEQRVQVLRALADELPEYERARAGTDPQSLARLATRAEMRRPGTLERAFAGRPDPGGVGLGGVLAGSLLASVAGSFLGTAIAQQLLADQLAPDLDAEGLEPDLGGDQEVEAAGFTDLGGDFGGDFGGDA